MAEPIDVVLPILKKIQDDMATGFKRVDAKLNDVAEDVLEIRDDIAEIKRDMLVHLGLTAKQRIDFDELRSDVADLKARMAALEARS